MQKLYVMNEKECQRVVRWMNIFITIIGLIAMTFGYLFSKAYRDIGPMVITGGLTGMIYYVVGIVITNGRSRKMVRGFVACSVVTIVTSLIWISFFMKMV